MHRCAIFFLSAVAADEIYGFERALKSSPFGVRTGQPNCRCFESWRREKWNHRDVDEGIIFAMINYDNACECCIFIGSFLTLKRNKIFNEFFVQLFSFPHVACHWSFYASARLWTLTAMLPLVVLLLRFSLEMTIEFNQRLSAWNGRNQLNRWSNRLEIEKR